MTLIILHDLDDEEILVNTDSLNAATRKYPDKTALIKFPFTKLYYVQKDGGMAGIGFPDSVKETPQEIFELANKVK